MVEQQPAEAKAPGLNDLYNHPLVKELVIPAIKKEYLGVDANENRDKYGHKSAWTRFMYSNRDFLQGTWWIFLLMSFFLMLFFLLFLYARKVLGV